MDQLVHLGHGNDIGHDSSVLEAPVVVPQPTKARLDLIGYAEAACRSYRLQPRKVTFRLEFPSKRQALTTDAMHIMFHRLLANSEYHYALKGNKQVPK